MLMGRSASTQTILPQTIYANFHSLTEIPYRQTKMFELLRRLPEIEIADEREERATTQDS